VAKINLEVLVMILEVKLKVTTMSEKVQIHPQLPAFPFSVELPLNMANYFEIKMIPWSIPKPPSFHPMENLFCTL
jgi:hypothetical protein